MAKTKKTTEAVEKPVKKAVAKPTANKLTKAIRKGMQVKILAGKDRGKTGEVLSYDRKTGRVQVQGIAELVDYQRNKIAGGGEKITKPARINISNVKLLK